MRVPLTKGAAHVQLLLVSLPRFQITNSAYMIIQFSMQLSGNLPCLSEDFGGLEASTGGARGLTELVLECGALLFF